MKLPLVVAVISAMLAGILFSCTPQPSPTTAPAPGASSSSATPDQPRGEAALVATDQEAAWQRVEQAAKKEGTLTVYAHFFTGDSARLLAAAFQQRYGIRTEILVVNSSVGVEKIKVEHRIGQPVADIINLGKSSSVDLTKSGLGKNVADELPILQDRGAFFIDPIVDPDKQILEIVPTFVGPLINTNRVKPQDEPQSYYDILDPKWKGKKIILTDPRTGAGTGFEWFTVTRYHKALDDSFYRRLVEQEPVLWGGGDTESYRMLARGEYYLTPAGGASSVASLVIEGAPLKALAMKEGTNASAEAVVVVKDSAHPNAAKLFANWILSDEGQTVYAKASYKTMLRKGVVDISPPAVRVQPKKILDRNWDLLTQSKEQSGMGLVEEIFGKK